MATASELLSRQEFTFESETTAGEYTFIVRVDWSPTVPTYSVVDVTDPFGERVASYPDQVATDIQTAITELKTHYDPTFDLDLATLTFQAVYEGPSPDAQIVTVGNVGAFGSLLSWDATSDVDWAQTLPTSDGGEKKNAETEVSVYVSTSELPVGDSVATISFTDAAATNTPQTVVATVTILPQAEIDTDRATMSFTGTVGGADPADQTLVVENTGPVDSLLNFTAGVIEVAATWLSVVPSSGGPLASAATENLTVAVDLTGLVAGTYTGTIRIIDETASNSPQTVVVTLVVS